nr:MAG TPA: hypothetical protein [Caudoviricetes sp.]
MKVIIFCVFALLWRKLAISYLKKKKNCIMTIIPHNCTRQPAVRQVQGTMEKRANPGKNQRNEARIWKINAMSSRASAFQVYTMRASSAPRRPAAKNAALLHGALRSGMRCNFRRCAKH